MISIITPVYNGEQFIESCIKVVIDQNCPNIEHIIVDGGSSDKTIDIIKQYADQYPHIRYISEKDRGQSDAMNKGIALAKNEIIGILNVDDFYEPNVLNRVLGIFVTLSEPSFLVGNCNVWDDQENIRFVNKPAKLRLIDILVDIDYPFPLNPSAYFYHKSLHSEIGLYDVEEHYVMDLIFILKAIQVAKVKYINETWGNYRNIRGTKSFNDYISGQSLKRRARILQPYKESLPPIQKLQLRIRRYFAYLISRCQYFFRYPTRLIPSIKDRLITIARNKENLVQ